MSNDPVQKKLDEAKRLGINASNPAILSAFARGNIEDAIKMSQPGGIKAGEAAGAASMLASDNLPKKGLEHREALEQLGFVFGNDVDDVLVAVTLPEGWRKECDSDVDSRHNKLVDSQGRKRAHVFLKTTSYDYTGYVSWQSRFSVNVIVEDGRDKYDLGDDEEALLVGVVMDVGKEIHRTEAKVSTRSGYKIEDQLRNEARKWLMVEYPDADKPFAHWE